MYYDHIGKLTGEQRRLAETNMAIAPYVLHNYFGTSFAMDEDNLSEAYFGLCKAAKKYDKDSGYTFATFATIVIINHIKSTLRHKRSQKRLPVKESVSLDRPIGEDGFTLADILPDPRGSAESTALDDIRQEQISALLAKIKREAPELVERKQGVTLRILAMTQQTSTQAVASRTARAGRRVKQKYNKEYRRIMYGEDVGKSDQGGRR